MASERAVVPVEPVERAIRVIRGQRVILDSDLAALYGVAAKRLLQQVRRNRNRFPSDFAFLLTGEDVTNLRLQNATSSLHGGRRYAPWAFTEHGAIMAATVLNSPRAVEMSLLVVRAFVRMRQVLATQKGFAEKLAELEKRVGTHDVAIRAVVEAIKKLAVLPELEYPRPPEKPHIGFKVGEKAAPYRQRKGKPRSAQ